MTKKERALAALSSCIDMEMLSIHELTLACSSCIGALQALQARLYTELKALLVYRTRRAAYLYVMYVCIYAKEVVKRNYIC